jgi:hypothetical protein
VGDPVSKLVAWGFPTPLLRRARPGLNRNPEASLRRASRLSRSASFARKRQEIPLCVNGLLIRRVKPDTSSSASRRPDLQLLPEIAQQDCDPVMQQGERVASTLESDVVLRDASAMPMIDIYAIVGTFARL